MSFCNCSEDTKTNRWRVQPDIKWGLEGKWKGKGGEGCCTTGCPLLVSLAQTLNFDSVVVGRKAGLVNKILHQHLDQHTFSSAKLGKLERLELDGAVAPCLSVHVGGCAVCASKTRAASSLACHVSVYATKTNVCACLVGSGSAMRGGGPGGSWMAGNAAVKG